MAQTLHSKPLSLGLNFPCSGLSPQRGVMLEVTGRFIVQGERDTVQGDSEHRGLRT